MRPFAKVSFLAFFVLSSSNAEERIPAEIGTKIFGGELVTTRDPYAKRAAALYAGSRFVCSGTILASDLFLTAAHCLADGSADRIRFGMDSTRGATPSRRIVAKRIHENYDDSFASPNPADIALVSFSGGLPAGYGTVPLLPAGAAVRAGEAATLVGYGSSHRGKLSGLGKLRKAVVKVKIPSASSTEVVFDQSRGQGACYGDSGGPAFVVRDGVYLQHGVASRVETLRRIPGDTVDRCGNAIYYTKVAPYFGWIERVARELRARKFAARRNLF